jgi:hypothetical protein
LAIYTVEVEDKDFNEYTYEELFNIAERDVFVACILENMINIFGEFHLSRVFPLYTGKSILTGLDSKNKPIYKDGINDIGTEEEMPKWLC